MHAIYHCVPAKTDQTTDDLNVISRSLFIPYRSEPVPGERKTSRKKAVESSSSVRRTRTRVMSGSLASSTSAPRPSTTPLFRSTATSVSL